MEQRYNICYAGEILPGQDLQVVRHNLARLFAASDATLDKLFSGREQTLKRDCDKATALKYKQAMEKAGAKPVVRAAAAEQAAPATPATGSAPMSAAQRIAAVATGSDPGQAPASAAAAAATEESISLAAAGSDVLRPEERTGPTPESVRAPALDISEVGIRLSQPAAAAPPAPDTTHLSMGEAGEDIPGLPSTETPLSPDTSGISLAAAGGDLSDCAPPPAAPLELDLSELDLSPAGTEVLEERYRRRDDAAAPPTDHLSLEE